MWNDLQALRGASWWWK